MLKARIDGQITEYGSPRNYFSEIIRDKTVKEILLLNCSCSLIDIYDCKVGFVWCGFEVERLHLHHSKVQTVMIDQPVKRLDLHNGWAGNIKINASLNVLVIHSNQLQNIEGVELIKKLTVLYE